MTKIKTKSRRFFCNVLLYHPHQSRFLEKGKFCILSSTSETVSEEEFLLMACERRGIRESEMKAALEDYFATVYRILSIGKSFNTQWLHGNVTAKGILESKDDYFSPKHNKNHKFGINVRLDYEMLDIIQRSKIPYKRSSSIEVKPSMQEAYDIFTREEDVLNTGEIAVIRGLNFDFNNMENVELFLQDMDDNKFPFTSFVPRSSGELHARVPADVPAGEYRLKLGCNLGTKYLEDTLTRMVTVK
ncbi:MAG: DUF4469 domain-containing protein [Bacteroidales bacterium]